MSLIKRGPFFLHPVFIFTVSLVALGTSLYLYIDSYLKVNDKLTSFVKKAQIPLDQFQDTQTWVMILTLSILVSLIVIGFSIVFFYYQKIRQLYRMQHNFINGFTHELKTPVASIGIFIDTMKKHEFERQKQIEYLNIMKQDTERLGDNIDQILQLGKLEEKKIRPELSLLPIKQIIDDFLVKNEHIFKDLKIKFKNLDSETLINFDRKLFDILLMNILTNSIRYNSKEHKELVIEHHHDNKWSILSFSDNGDGIEKKELGNIFKKFYQVGKSSKGSGIGLYMTMQIMKIHLGKVLATSEGIGKGATIKLSFKRDLDE